MLSCYLYCVNPVFCFTLKHEYLCLLDFTFDFIHKFENYLLILKALISLKNIQLKVNGDKLLDS